MNLLRKKKQVGERSSQIRRHLGLVDLIFLGIGSMVGTGIFTVTGLAGPICWSCLNYFYRHSTISVGLTALFYAEFASRIPTNGGAYGYLYTVSENFLLGLLVG